MTRNRITDTQDTWEGKKGWNKSTGEKICFCQEMGHFFHCSARGGRNQWSWLQFNKGESKENEGIFTFCDKLEKSSTENEGPRGDRTSED